MMGPRREDFGEEVGVAEFDFQSLDGRKRRVRIRVGRPYFVSSAEWACPVELQGLEARHPDIRGVTSLHALCLGLSLARSRVADLVDKGGKFLDTGDGTEWEPDEVVPGLGGFRRDSDDAG